MAANAYLSKAVRQIAGSHPDGFIPVGGHKSDATIATATEIFPGGNFATDLTADQQNRVNVITIQANGQPISYTLDGTTPTATLGFILPVNGTPLRIPLAPSTILKVIETAVTGTLQYQFGLMQQ